MNEAENRIVFRDFTGDIHDIYIKHITEFGKLLSRYCIRFIKIDGIAAYCYLSAENPTNYVVYRGMKYTNNDFQKLVLVVKNENNLAAIEEL